MVCRAFLPRLHIGGFLETAELRAKRRQDIAMRFWMENVGQIIASNGFAPLEGAGTISREHLPLLP